MALLLVGDTLEDTVTYVAEPDRLEVHLAELDRIASWGYPRLLPNHGDPDIIAAGGYGPELITATKLYVEKLIRARTDAALAGAGPAAPSPPRRSPPAARIISRPMKRSTPAICRTVRGG